MSFVGDELAVDFLCCLRGYGSAYLMVAEGVGPLRKMQRSEWEWGRVFREPPSFWRVNIRKIERNDET